MGDLPQGASQKSVSHLCEAPQRVKIRDKPSAVWTPGTVFCHVCFTRFRPSAGDLRRFGNQLLHKCWLQFEPLRKLPLLQLLRTVSAPHVQRAMATIWEAAVGGQIATLKTLLRRGASVNAENPVRVELGI